MWINSPKCEMASQIQEFAAYVNYVALPALHWGRHIIEATWLVSKTQSFVQKLAKCKKSFTESSTVKQKSSKVDTYILRV